MPKMVTINVKYHQIQVYSCFHIAAIRQKNQAVNFLRMSARVDAVASRVQTAVTTKRVTSSMQGVVKAMDSAMKSMNLEKISNLMDKFEKEFEDLDVQTSVMEGAMVSHYILMIMANANFVNSISRIKPLQRMCLKMQLKC